MKPHFKLRLDGSFLPLRDPLAQALLRARRESDAPVEPGVFRSLDAFGRSSLMAESCLRRQILHAFGTLGEFGRVTGIKPWVLGAALNPRLMYITKGSEVGRLKLQMGLPLRGRIRTEAGANV